MRVGKVAFSKNDMEQRQIWIDYAKGIAILLVIFGHIRSCFFEDNLTVIIGTLHNPTFFLISGYLLTFAQGTSLGKIFMKYIRRLCIPFCIWLFLYGVAVFLMTNESLRGSFLDAANRLWFLPVLFLGVLFCYILHRQNIWIVSLFVGACVFLLLTTLLLWQRF